MKKFIKKTLLFNGFGFVLFLSFFYLNLYFGNQSEIFKEVNVVLKSKPEVILFGSSVNKYSADEDSDNRSISEMLNDNLPTKKVDGISHPAYQSDIYFDILKYCEQDVNSSLFIIPINLRSFSPLWDLRPQYQFIDEKYYFRKLPHYINFLKFNKLTKSEFDKFPIFFKQKKIGEVYSFDKTPMNDDLEKKKGFISSYMQPLKMDNQKLLKLIETQKYAQNNNLRVMFYITPIDWQSGINSGLDNFEVSVKENIKTILFSLEGAHILDLSRSIPSDFFDYDIRPNEHLNMKGRNFVAKELAKEVLKYN